MVVAPEPNGLLEAAESTRLATMSEFVDVIETILGIVLLLLTLNAFY